MEKNIAFLVCFLVMVIDVVAGILGIQAEVAENKVVGFRMQMLMYVPSPESAMGSGFSRRRRSPVQKGTVIPSSHLRLRRDRSFPAAVVIEILSRLPIKSLARCQVISKEWRALINDPYLTEIHLDRADVVDHWCNTAAPASSDDGQTPFDRISYRHGCNGLILIMNINLKKHYIWNPAIRLALELPDPHDRTLGFAFSYVPSTRNFRIVSFYKNESSSSLCCQVLTPGENSWRELEVPEASRRTKIGERDSVVLSGSAVHCVGVTKVGNRTYTDVVSLDLETEKFTVSRLPEYSKDYWDLDWDGKLGFADIVGENLEVVELDDYKSGKWSERKRVVRLGFENRENAIPLFAKKGEIWFWMKDEKIFRYTIDTGRWVDERVVQSLSLLNKIFVYKPSLISFEGMGPDTKFRHYAPLFL